MRIISPSWVFLSDQLESRFTFIVDRATGSDMMTKIQMDRSWWEDIELDYHPAFELVKMFHTHVSSARYPVVAVKIKVIPEKYKLMIKFVHRIARWDMMQGHGFEMIIN